MGTVAETPVFVRYAVQVWSGAERQARTLQDWEQGRREPTGAARTLLKVAVKHPKLLRALET